MKTLLITGVHRAAGANLAAVLSERFHVVTLSESGTIIAGCESPAGRCTDPDVMRSVVTGLRPDVVIHAGPLSESCWAAPVSDSVDEPRTTRALCDAATEADARFILVSSDRVYRGPWMFHSEDSDCLDTSAATRCILACEEHALQAPGGLVFRTNVVGWTPDGGGLLELMLQRLERGAAFDFGHFSTPIAAGRFARIVADAVSAGLSGLFNVGGAERTSPFSFAEGLAKQFDLPVPEAAAESCAIETSVQSRAVRQALHVALPTLRETVEQLFEDREQCDLAFGRAGHLASAA